MALKRTLESSDEHLLKKARFQTSTSPSPSQMSDAEFDDEDLYDNSEKPTVIQPSTAQSQSPALRMLKSSPTLLPGLNLATVSKLAPALEDSMLDAEEVDGQSDIYEDTSYGEHDHVEGMTSDEDMQNVIALRNGEAVADQNEGRAVNPTTSPFPQSESATVRLNGEALAEIQHGTENETSLPATPLQAAAVVEISAKVDQAVKATNGVTVKHATSTAHITSPAADALIDEKGEVDEEDEVEFIIDGSVTQQQLSSNLSEAEKKVLAGLVEAVEASVADKMDVDEQAEWEIDSDPEVSDSDEDSSDSNSSESDEDSEDEPYTYLDAKEQARILMQEEGGSPEPGRPSTKGGKSGPRTANEKPDIVIERPDIVITPDMKIEPLGVAEAIVENMLVVRGNATGREKVLESGSLLCSADRSVVGVVLETMGRVDEPFYCVPFTNAAQISSLGITVGMKIFNVPSHSQYVFTTALRKIKGSDASNQFDEEIGEEELEFSDDEKEAEHKKRAKMAKRGKQFSGPPEGRDGGSPPGQPAKFPSAPMSYDDDDDDLYTPLARPQNLNNLTVLPRPPAQAQNFTASSRLSQEQGFRGNSIHGSTYRGQRGDRGGHGGERRAGRGGNRGGQRGVEKGNRGRGGSHNNERGGHRGSQSLQADPPPMRHSLPQPPPLAVQVPPINYKGPLMDQTTTQNSIPEPISAAETVNHTTNVSQMHQPTFRTTSSPQAFAGQQEPYPQYYQQNYYQPPTSSFQPHFTPGTQPPYQVPNAYQFPTPSGSNIPPGAFVNPAFFLNPQQHAYSGPAGPPHYASQQQQMQHPQQNFPQYGVQEYSQFGVQRRGRQSQDQANSDQGYDPRQPRMY